VADVAYYVALPFVVADDGVAAGEPLECFNPVAVVMRSEALSRKEGYVGAVAFSRTGDPAIGDFSGAKVIRKFGEVPNDRATTLQFVRAETERVGRRNCCWPGCEFLWMRCA
jgi:hypothetical protein